MLTRLVAALAAGEARDVARRLRIASVLYVLAAVLAVFGGVFLVLAAYIAAAERWGAIAAAAGFGVGFLVLALIVVAALKVWTGMRRRRARRRRAADVGALAGSAALAAVPSLVARSGLGSLIVPLALIAGYAIYRENAGSGDRDEGDDA